MIGVRGLARTLLAGIFFVGASASWKRAAGVGTKAERLAEPLGRATGVPVTGEDLVRINAGVQIAAGTLFVLGVQQRVMAVVLAGTLVPTTLVGHPFWEIDDEGERMSQLLNFLKNAAMIGGLTFAALDTGGRPSIFWSGKKAAESLAGSVKDAIER